MPVHRCFRLLGTLSLLLLIDACTDSPGEAQGEGTIAGMVSGPMFESVGASYRIGAPDDPERTVVVYVFDAALACEELDSPAWDERVGDGVQALEMKLVGKTTGSFPVALGPTPGAGEASVNYTLTSTSATPMELSATGGSVTLTALGDDTARGEFDLSFADGGSLQGSFDAAACAGGHEP